MSSMGSIANPAVSAAAENTLSLGVSPLSRASTSGSRRGCVSAPPIATRGLDNHSVLKPVGHQRHRDGEITPSTAELLNSVSVRSESIGSSAATTSSSSANAVVMTSLVEIGSRNAPHPASAPQNHKAVKRRHDAAPL